MLTTIYECSLIAINAVVSMLIAQYVFLIPTMKKQRILQSVFTISGSILSLLICILFGVPAALICEGIVMGLYIFLAYRGEKRQYLKTLQIFPIIGLSFGVLYPVVDVPMIALGEPAEIMEGFALIVHLLLLFSYALIRAMCSDWFRHFRKDTLHRKLTNGDRWLLCIIGMLMLGVLPTLNAYSSSIRLTDVRALRCITMLVCLIVTLTVCILVMRCSQNTYLRDQVLQMQNNLIITMADIVENRDENTGGHIRRTAKYVEIIGNSLRKSHYYTNILTDQYLADMIVAAPLHDIGKIHIPDAVLKKEGRFTEEEFRIMKSHTIAGKLLLLRAEKHLGYSDYLNVAVQMAGYHHEWFNGRGYPEGLKEQDIPLCARIMAVADVFDSLVSQRCYKGALEVDQAFSMIAEERGTHFDPIVVDAFLCAREQVTAIAHEFTEHPLTQDIDKIPVAGTAFPIRPELEKNKLAKAG